MISRMHALQQFPVHADIITLATRDAVALSGGPKYEVPTGRRDGFVSDFEEVDIQAGVAHCSFFQSRFLNADSTMNHALKTKLVKLCLNATGREDPVAFLDHKTPFKVDKEFYEQILLKRGILQIVQQLALDTCTSRFVTGFASNNAKFLKSFADTMIKMGKIEVLVGNAG